MAEILNPQDAELEEVILGACLIGREAMPMVADRLRPEMFYFDKKRFDLCRHAGDVPGREADRYYHGEE